MLYYGEWRLPSTLKKAYDEIRQDPAWYLQKELIKDCIAKGGCCSRGCRCCENRHLNSERRNGIGHCTEQCGCCGSHRGSELTLEEVTDIADCFCEALYSSSPEYLLMMSEAYFLVRPKSFSIPRKVVQRLKRVYENTFR